MTRVFGRHHRGFAVAVAGALVLLLGAPAQAGAPSLPLTLIMPARLSPHASEGLFTAVTRAGASLIAVGEQGRIMRTSDNGRSWRQMACPTSVTLTGVAFMDAVHGWAIGQMGVVLKTGDGGQSWTRVLDGVTANKILLDAAQTDLEAQNNSAAATANLQAARQFVAGGTSVPFLALMANSPTDIIAAGGFGMAFESHDGGVSWTAIFDAIPNPNGLNIYRVLAAPGLIYFIGEQGFLVTRGPAGAYAPLSPPAQGTLFGGITTKAGTLLLYGVQGAVLRSADGGAHWTTPASGTGAGIDAGLAESDGAIVLGDLAGNLIVSKDDGQSFAGVKMDEPVTGLAETADGALIVTGPLGLRRVPFPVPGA